MGMRHIVNADRTLTATRQQVEPSLIKHPARRSPVLCIIGTREVINPTKNHLEDGDR